MSAHPLGFFTEPQPPGSGSVSLEKSYAFCLRVAKTRARNFYYSFILLAPEQKRAMCAMYAFMRYCDDISEGEGASLAAIEQWRSELDSALKGEFSGHPVWPAVHDTVKRFQIPHQYLFDMIRGVSSDLQPRQILTFDELYEYCYLVASVVGLTTIHIFGFDDPKAPDLAEKCGIAFQLTNILRDVKEDRENHRVYLPAGDITRYRADITRYDQRFIDLMEFEAARARDYYAQSRPLIGMVHPRSRGSLWALIEIYRRLLERIVRSRYDVLGRRVRVPAWEKMSIVARASLKL
jgi:15-cis-phytoene synthase